MEQELSQLKANSLKLCNSLAFILSGINNKELEKITLFKELLSRFNWFYQNTSFENSSKYWDNFKIETELFKMMKDDQSLEHLYKEANPFNLLT